MVSSDHEGFVVSPVYYNNDSVFLYIKFFMEANMLCSQTLTLDSRIDKLQARRKIT